MTSFTHLIDMDADAAMRTVNDPTTTYFYVFRGASDGFEEYLRADYTATHASRHPESIPGELGTRHLAADKAAGWLGRGDKYALMWRDLDDLVSAALDPGTQLREPGTDASTVAGRNRLHASYLSGHHSWPLDPTNRAHLGALLLERKMFDLLDAENLPIGYNTEDGPRYHDDLDVTDPDLTAAIDRREAKLDAYLAEHREHLATHPHWQGHYITTSDPYSLAAVTLAAPTSTVLRTNDVPAPLELSEASCDATADAEPPF
ncbi:hypothetical protein [Nocardia sp. XZ_19_369]|uniref:hypothetical protein n=1 Tax=Nocardia sp. XZ_19_369 TaxID=2769487 RepID=UPI001E4D6D76|nr:hypothetical protein [Nocardia sp. XZ_19_369]